MAKGGTHGEGGGMCGEGVCVWQRLGMCGKGKHARQRGICMAKGGTCMQERRPLKRAVRILLECILVYCFFYTFSFLGGKK